MKISIAATAGFCWGVKRAIDKVFDLRDHTSEEIQTYGPLIHNPQILEQLENKNINTTKSLEDIDGVHVVVRTHGIAPRERKELQTKNARILDTTCPDVARIQARIKRSVKHGQEIIIAGHSGHAEVRGLMGYAGKNGYLVESASDVEELPEMENVTLVSQSTFSKSGFSAISDAVRRKFPSVEVYNTICEATHDRQLEVRKLAREVDVMIVIGGKFSSNTRRLAEISKSFGTKTLYIETEAELKTKMFSGVENVGVTGGASTPDWIIDQVVCRLKEIDRELNFVEVSKG